MNNVVLIGRIVADPELKTTASGVEVTSFRIAVDRPYQKDIERKTDFIGIVAWRKTAAFICQYFTKGKPIAIKGSLQTRSYEAGDGSKRNVVEVLADSVEFVVGAKSGENKSSQHTYDTPPAENNQNYNDMPLDDDLPF